MADDDIRATMNGDRTPGDDLIETYTFWLPFPDGDVAISADLTQWNAAMKRAREAAPGARKPPPAR
jgi:hypothetical protein